MAQVKVNKMSLDQISNLLKDAGVNLRPNREVMASSSLPSEGVFTDCRPDKNPNGGQPIIRIIAVGTDGVTHECALGRINPSGIKKLNKDHELTESDLVLGSSKYGMRYRVKGKNLNNLPFAQDHAAFAIIGKKFKATPAERLDIGFINEGQPNYESKKQALESGYVAPYYELEIIGDAE